MLNSESKKKLIEQTRAARLRRKKSARISGGAAEQRRLDDQGSMEGERFKTLVENIPCAVYSAFPGETGPTTFMSSKWKDWTGYSPEELYQDPEAWPKCIHPDDREETIAAYSGACRDEAPYNLEYRVVHKDTGQVRYVADQGLLSKDEKGAITKVDGIVTDITKLKEAENELRTCQDHLEELVKERTAELSRAHEVLRTEDAERKKAEEVLRESEERLRTLFEKSPLSITVLDLAGTVSDCNKATETLIGYSREEIIGRRFEELSTLHPEDLPVLREKYGRLSEGLEVGPYELEIIRKDGETRWISTQSSPLMKEGVLTGVQVISEDITERRRAEEALRMSELRIRSLIGQTTDAVFCYEYDPPISTDLPMEDQVKLLYDGVLVECNDVCAKSYGVDRAEEVIGRKLTELFGTRPGSLDKLFRGLIEGGYRIVDGLGVEKLEDGTERHYLNNGHGVVEDGRLVRVWGTFRDITDRKQAEEALRESESNYKAVVENAREGIVVAQDKKLRFVNSHIADVTGYSEKELMSRPFIEFVHPDDQERLMGIYMKRLKGEETPDVYEFKVVDKKGNTRWLENNGILIEWEGRPATLNFLRDVTERKRAEEELRVKDNAIASSITAVAIGKFRGNLTYVNNSFLKMWGYDDESEVLGKPAVEFWQTKEKALQIMEALNDGDSVIGELVAKRKDGSLFDVQLSASAVTDETGVPVSMMGSFTDITERKKAEEALKYRLEFEELVAEVSTHFINLRPGEIDAGITSALGEIGSFAGVDRSYVFLVNQSGTHMSNTHEWCAENIESNKERLQELEVETFPWATDQLKRLKTLNIPLVAALPQEAEAEKTILQAGGIQSLVAVPIVIGGELFGFLGFDSVSEQKNWSNDIISMMKIVAEIFANALERKRTDEALSESESRFRELVENIREVFWMENADGTELLYVSPAYEQVWGRSCQSFYENPRDWIESIHPEDRQRVVDAFSQFRETEKYSEEFRIVRPDGTIRWIWDRGVLIRDEFGEVTRVAGIAKDITERKRAEETLRVREQTLRALINAPTESAILVDAEGTILDINRIAAERLGKSEERLIGMGMYDYLPADIAEYRKAQGDEVLRSGKPVRFQDEREGRYYDTNLYPVFDDEDKVSALAIFSGDITERKKAEASLRENEEKLRNVVERANDGIVILQDGLLKYVNPRTAEITGYTVEEMTNTPFARYVPPDELPKLADIYERRMAGEEIVSIYETAVRHKDGSDVHIEVNAGLITYEGKPADLAFARDITERKRTEEALQRSERMFRTYFELGLVGMAVTSPEKGWIYVNDNLCKMLGYSRDELFQTTWADLTHPEDLQADIDQFEQVLAGKIDGYSMDKRFIRKDGQIVYVSLSVACLRREDGSVEHFIAHLQDITDRKKAKKALQDNEARYRSLVANIPDVVWTSDEKGNTTFISANVEGIYGYSPEEVYSQSDNLWFGRIHPDDIEGVKESFKAVFESGGQLDLEYRVKRKDGEWIWIRDRSIGAYEKDGVKYADGVFSDITERKQAEEALSESEKRYRDLVETSLDMIFMLDRDGNFIFTNRAWSENIGYSGDEAKTMDGFELVLPEDLDHVRKRFASVIGGKVENNLEFRSRTKKGEYRNILINGSPVFDSEGGVIGILGSGMDITERKKGEQALRESEAKFRSLAEQSPNMIFINKQGRVVYANKKCEEIMGYRREEFCSPDFDFLTLIAPESVDTVKENYARHSRGEDVPPYDYTLINRDGERIEAINTSKLIQYEGQTAILGIVTDITERIKAENALRESEERLKILFGSAPDGIYLNDLEGRFVDGNRAAEELIGYEKAEVVGKSFAEAGLLSAEQLPRALARLEKTAAGEPVGPDEFTLKRKDGSHVAVEIRTFPVRIKDEMLSLGIARDITERKKAEQALREERDRAQQYLDVAAVMFVALDSQGNVTLINEKGCELLGWDESEIVGKNWFDNFLPEDIKEQIKTIFLELMAGNIEPVEYHENAILCNDGSQKIIAWHNTVLKDGSGSIIGILSSGQDITERKQGEKVLLDHQAQLKSLASQLSLTEERERRRLATELHDQIGQSLVISKIKLDQLRGSSTSDELTKALEEVCDCLGQVIDDARTLTFDLSSPILYELGLEAAVAEWLTEQIQQKHGIETEFEDDGQQKPLDDDIRTILFRNVRELLINIVKHAQADKVKVSICRADEDIHISIDDDGVGFDPVEVTSMAAKRAEFGLFSIRERLEQLGGLIEIESELGRGSKIAMTAPLKYKNVTDGTQV